MGPYKFVEYHGDRKVTATIADGRGKRTRVSVANLVPLRPEPNPAWVVRISEQPVIFGEDIGPGEVVDDSNDDNLFSSDDEEEVEEVEAMPIPKKPRGDGDAGC